jgi:hypothetical protein
MAGNVIHHSNTHFLFHTLPQKATLSCGSQIDARLQTARDGAFIVNYIFGSAGMRILTSTRYSLKHDVSPSLLT